MGFAVFGVPQLCPLGKPLAKQTDKFSPNCKLGSYLRIFYCISVNKIQYRGIVVALNCKVCDVCVLKPTGCTGNPYSMCVLYHGVE